MMTMFRVTAMISEPRDLRMAGATLVPSSSMALRSLSWERVATDIWKLRRGDGRLVLR